MDSRNRVSRRCRNQGSSGRIARPADPVVGDSGEGWTGGTSRTHVKHLEDKLWEFRVKAEGGIARGIYVTAARQRVVVLHVFAKKSRRTPRRALATARERMKQVTR